MDKQELVSVIIPAYNLESYIERSLRSVLEQTYENIEIIVVNDGSKDKTAQVAEKILRNAGKSYRIINQENQGVSVARNIGLSVAQGKYIKFLDGDDTLFPWTIEELVRAIEENNCDIAFGGQNVVNLKGKVLYRYDEMYKYVQGIYEASEILRAFLLRITHISLNSSIFLKEIIDKNLIKFIPGAKYSEDNEFISKYLYYARNVFVFNKAVAKALYRLKSTTKIPSLSAFHNVGAMLRLKRFFEERNVQEIAKIIELECIPDSYVWTIGNLAFNGYPLFDWLRIAKMDKVRRNIISCKIHNKHTKFGKQQNFLINLFRFSPFLVYVLLRSYACILRIMHKYG
ncbi:MAG: glycosyltransferase family 2 protein [Fervidobacterium sp.]|uniref:glycosyltransferase family 2 protein n=1 Tax=Fervidobacterium sp. TaxID=1871331 RepID=UPI00404ACF3B